MKNSGVRGGGDRVGPPTGPSIRDQFAMSALQGLLISPEMVFDTEYEIASREERYQLLVNDAYVIADMMLKAKSAYRKSRYGTKTDDPPKNVVVSNWRDEKEIE